MRVLKDIKVSKLRIPVQNALWIRPMGGLQFKLYIPSGTDWKEFSISDSPSPTPTPEPTKKTKRNNCEGGKVIVGKLIPKYPTVGDRYYFADGVVKFKKSLHSSMWSVIAYDTYTGTYRTGVTSDTKSLIKVGNKHRPVIATIIESGLSNMSKVKISKFDNAKKSEVENVTCDTTSPYFKIIEGKLRHIQPQTTFSELVPFNKFRFIPREHGRGHEIRPLKTGWAIVFPKKRKQSKTRATSVGHTGNVRERQLVKVTKNTLESSRYAHQSRFVGKSAFLRIIRKRRLSNMFRGYAVVWDTLKETPIKITTEQSRV